MNSPRLRRRISIRPQTHAERALDAIVIFIASMGVITWVGTLHPEGAFALGAGWAAVVWFWVRDWR